MSNLFHDYLYAPLLKALIFIYTHFAFGDLGIAIIILTLGIRIVLLPLFYKGAKDQALMNRLQPKIKKIQEQYKNNKEEQAKALLALYRENKLNPFSGVLVLFIQLPILIALYQVFLKGLSGATFDNPFFLSLIDLGKRNLPMALVAATAQYFQGRLTFQKNKIPNDPMVASGKMLMVIGPFLTWVILVNLPSALALYWIISTAFSIIQQIYINKKLSQDEGSFRKT